MGWFSHQLVNDEGKENDPHFFPYTVEVGTSGGESAGFGEKNTSFVAAGGNKYLKSLGLAACHINATWMYRKKSGRRILAWCSWVTRAKMQP